MPVAEFPFPGPRRVPPRRVPPDPASGQAPTLEELLLEAATLRPAHPGDMTAAEQARVAQIVNDPSFTNVPPEILGPAAGNLGIVAGASGMIPELGNNVLTQLVRELLKRLDVEGRVSPTVARGLTSETTEPSVMDLLGAAESKTPFSSAFGPEPTQDIEASTALAQQMLGRLRGMEPDILHGERSAIEAELLPSGPPGADYTAAIEQATPGSSTGVEFNALLTDLLSLLDAARVGPSPEAAVGAAQTLQNQSLAPENIASALIDAIRMSGSGGGPASNFDPVARRSLAPAIDAGMLNRMLQAQGQEDTDFIIRMMGLTPNRPGGPI